MWGLDSWQWIQDNLNNTDIPGEIIVMTFDCLIHLLIKSYLNYLLQSWKMIIYLYADLKLFALLHFHQIVFSPAFWFLHTLSLFFFSLFVYSDLLIHSFLLPQWIHISILWSIHQPDHEFIKLSALAVALFTFQAWSFHILFLIRSNDFFSINWLYTLHWECQQTRTNSWCKPLLGDSQTICACGPTNKLVTG